MDTTKNDSNKISKDLLSKEEDPLKGKISPINEIVIDVDKVLKLEDNSITDSVLIRQIGLATTRYNYISREDSRALSRKIRHEYQYAALYPEVMADLSHIKPDNGE